MLPPVSRLRPRRRHIWLALLCIACGMLIGNVVYVRVKPAASRGSCTMTWLQAQLELSPQQFSRIEALHKQHAISVKRILDNANGSDPCPIACHAATQKLIDDVCAELTPEQKAKYRLLVTPCSRGKKAKR